MSGDISIGGLVINFTPFAQAKMSNGLFQCVEGYTATDMPVLNYFLYCASIELGLKASILSTDNSPAKKRAMRRPIGHDLEMAYAAFETAWPATPLFDSADLVAMGKINPFYRQKGLEYVTMDVIVQLLHGLSGFPAMHDIRAVALKVNDFLKRHEFFRA